MSGETPGSAMVWAYRTTKRFPTGETTFLLSYRTEVIILVDICMHTLRTEEINQDLNAIQLCLAQDQSEESRREAHKRIASYNNKSRPPIIRR